MRAKVVAVDKPFLTPGEELRETVARPTERTALILKLPGVQWGPEKKTKGSDEVKEDIKTKR